MPLLPRTRRLVPRLIDDLKEYRDLTGAKLRELAGQPVRTKPGLHARCALLADEPAGAGPLAAYLTECKPEELLTIRAFLIPHAADAAPAWWAVVTDEMAEPGKRVRAAGALGRADPGRRTVEDGRARRSWMRWCGRIRSSS